MLKLEEKLDISKGIGTKILELIKKKRIRAAAEIAFNEYGLERALKILVNAGQGEQAGLFAEQKGYYHRALTLYEELGMRNGALRLYEELGIPMYKRPRLKRDKSHRQFNLNQA